MTDQKRELFSKKANSKILSFDSDSDKDIDLIEENEARSIKAARDSASFEKEAKEADDDLDAALAFGLGG